MTIKSDSVIAARLAGFGFAAGRWHLMTLCCSGSLDDSHSFRGFVTIGAPLSGSLRGTSPPTPPLPQFAKQLLHSFRLWQHELRAFDTSLFKDTRRASSKTLIKLQEDSLKRTGSVL